MNALIVLASYLLGSVPSGYLMVRWTGRKDVRDYGSRSTGATNVLRVGGWKTALPVALFDILKGFLPVFLAGKLAGDPLLAALCGAAAVVGHCFPFAIGFRGGKGVATALGAFAAISAVPVLASAGVFLVVVSLTRYVSLGSVLAALVYPAVFLAVGGRRAVALVAAGLAVLIVLRHRANIARLLEGTERKLGEKAS